MPATATALDNLTLNITHEVFVRATLDATFASMLEQMGPGNETPEGEPLPMTIEPWPGGRWFRDLGRTTVTSGDRSRRSSGRRCSRSPGRCSCPIGHVERAVPAQGSRRRHGDRVPAHGVRHRARSISRRRGPGLGVAARSDQEGGRGCGPRPEGRSITMSMIDGLLQELEQEAQTTRRVLERVPQTIASRGSRTRSRCRSVSWRCTSPRCPARLRRFRGSRRCRCRHSRNRAPPARRS